MTKIIADQSNQLNKRLVALAASILIIVFVLQAVFSMRQKSVTVDEITYIATGYYHLKTGDFQMNMTNPPFMKVVSAVPLLLIQPDLPPLPSDPLNWDAIQEWQYGREFMYNNSIDADAILFTARLIIVLVAALLAIYLFFWAKELYGAAASLFALFLLCFSPNILAHARFATQDLGLTAVMFIATYYFWKYMNMTAVKYLLLCGVLTGVAIVTKSTAFLLLPIFAAYSLVLILKKDFTTVNNKFPIVKRIVMTRIRLRQLIWITLSFIIIGLLILITVNVLYGFQGSLRPLDPTFAQKIGQRLPDNGAVQAIANLFWRLPIPLPSPYLQSLIFQFRLASGSGNIFFAGDYYNTGLWYLMPITLGLKTPLPTLILFLISFIFAAWQWKRLNAEWLMLIFITAVLFFFMFLANLNTGVRYLLAIYPFMFLFISRLFIVAFKRPQPARAIVALLSVWYVLAGLFIYPHYLSYFNEVVGGPANGYKYLTESNVDWGQDLKALKAYMEENDIERIKLAYFGSADANYYGIDYDYLPSVGLTPQNPDQYWWYEIDSEEKKLLAPQQGIVAVSVNILTAPGWLHPLFHNSYDWLRQYEPVDRVGYSILIYEIDGHADLENNN